MLFIGNSIVINIDVKGISGLLCVSVAHVEKILFVRTACLDITALADRFA